MAQDPVVTRLMRNDPRVGEKIAFPALEDLHGNPVEIPFPNGMTALLYERRCQESGFHQDVQLLEAGATGYPQVKTCVVFSACHPETLEDMIRGKGYRSVFLYDRARKVADALNAFGIARLYLIDNDGTLLYLEDPTDPIEKLVAEIKQIVQATHR